MGKDAYNSWFTHESPKQIALTGQIPLAGQASFAVQIFLAGQIALTVQIAPTGQIPLAGQASFAVQIPHTVQKSLTFQIAPTGQVPPAVQINIADYLIGVRYIVSDDITTITTDHIVELFLGVYCDIIVHNYIPFDAKIMFAIVVISQYQAVVPTIA